MKVKDMMHKGAECVAPDATLQQVALKMRDYDIGAIPVCEGGKPIGMVTDRDVTIRAIANGKDSAALLAKDVMSKNVVFCRDTEEAEDAIRIMEDNQVRRLPVLDEAQKLVGMVSLGDISHALSRDLAGEVTKAVSAHHD
ncbi:MAG TPA: CBS domain-containing protein [Methyloceanibacter sp.]|jgi:CBS domain-containing protein|nr:CBS domain-containing protein [Methyloceanibacter sp.]